MIDIATGLSMLAPTAWSMRNATSASRLRAKLHSSEARVKSVRPTWNTRRRPKRSAIEPASISRLATTMVYASTTHWRPAVLACRSRRIDGSATFTMVTSSETMSRLRQQMARTSPGRPFKVVMLQLYLHNHCDATTFA